MLYRENDNCTCFLSSNSSFASEFINPKLLTSIIFLMERIRKIVLSAVLLMFCSIIYAQNKITASGTIVDETGAPVIGATIMEKVQPMEL